MSAPHDSWGDRLRAYGAQIQAEMEAAWNSARASAASSSTADTTAMAAMFRPDLRAAPDPLRRLLEPLIGILGMVALGGLLSLGLVSLASLLASAALIFALLTYVFGIELDLNPRW